MTRHQSSWVRSGITSETLRSKGPRHAVLGVRHRERVDMERAIARASQAYKANEIALDDGGHLPTTEEEQSVHGPAVTPAAVHVEASPKSERNLNHVKSARHLRTAAAVTVNLRDCGAISRILRQGRMFRSSQVMRWVDICIMSAYRTYKDVHLLAMSLFIVTAVLQRLTDWASG